MYYNSYYSFVNWRFNGSHAAVGQGFVNSQVSSGISAPLAWLAIIAEFFGGLAILFGLLTRLTAFGIACTMAVAVFHVHWVNGFLTHTLPNGATAAGFEYPLTLLMNALALIITGAGQYSLDALFQRTQPRMENRPHSTTRLAA